MCIDSPKVLGGERNNYPIYFLDLKDTLTVVFVVVVFVLFLLLLLVSQYFRKQSSAKVGGRGREYCCT